MEQSVCTILPCIEKIAWLNEEHFAELVGLDESVKNIYEKVRGDYDSIIEYVQQNFWKLKKDFQEAVAIITGLGEDNYLSIIRQNLIGSDLDSPINSAAELYFVKRGAAKQLYNLLLSNDSGEVFYCRKFEHKWVLSEDRLAELQTAINNHLRTRRQPELTGISGFQIENIWRILLHRPEFFLGDGVQQSMINCAVMDFDPQNGLLRLIGITQPWRCINFSTTLGVVFFDDWNFFDSHKLFSLSAILNYGLAIPSIKSPVKKIIAQTVSIVSGIGVVSNYSLNDCNNYLRLMFGRGYDSDSGNEISSITLQVIFSGKAGTVKVYSDHLESDLDEAALMFVEECLFSGKILLVSSGQPLRGKSFWRQMPFIMTQKVLCLDNWHRVLDGCVDFELFRSAFLTLASGYDNIASCKNHACGKHCMTDIFGDNGNFFTICTGNPEISTPIESDYVQLHGFRENDFIRLLAEQLKLKSDIRYFDNITWDIGVMTSGKTHQCRIFLSFAPPDLLSGIIMKICLVTKTPAVILAVAQAHNNSDNDILMQQHHVCCLNISDYIGVDFHCRLTVSEQLRMQCFPDAEEQSSLRPIVVPPGTKWEDITLKFKDNHTLSCIIGDQGSVHSFWSCGMADLRTEHPNNNWLLLSALARNKGVWKLDWQNRRRALQEQQRKKRLCTALKKLFDIPGDPIIFDGDKFEYRSLIKLRD